jgi:hypothetical protein
LKPLTDEPLEVEVRSADFFEIFTMPGVRVRKYLG